MEVSNGDKDPKLSGLDKIIKRASSVKSYVRNSRLQRQLRFPNVPPTHTLYIMDPSAAGGSRKPLDN